MTRPYRQPKRRCGNVGCETLIDPWKKFCSRRCYGAAKVGTRTSPELPLCAECGKHQVKRRCNACCSMSCAKRRDHRISPATQAHAKRFLEIGQHHPNTIAAIKKTIARARTFIKPGSREARGRQNVEDGTMSRAAFAWRRFDYGGVAMRSTYEVAAAQLFDELGLPWDYEPVRVLYQHPTGRRATYIPDFRLPTLGGVFIEMKSSYHLDRDRAATDAKVRGAADAGLRVFVVTSTDALRELLDRLRQPVPLTV